MAACFSRLRVKEARCRNTLADFPPHPLLCNYCVKELEFSLWKSTDGDAAAEAQLAEAPSGSQSARVTLVTTITSSRWRPPSVYFLSRSILFVRASQKTRANANLAKKSVDPKSAFGINQFINNNPKDDSLILDSSLSESTRWNQRSTINLRLIHQNQTKCCFTLHFTVIKFVSHQNLVLAETLSVTSPHQNGVNFSSVIISHWLTFWVKSRVLRVGPRWKSTVCLKHVWSTGVKQTHSCKNGQMFNRETVFPLGLLTETCESGGFLDSTRTWSSALLPLVHCHENVAVVYFSPLTSHLDMQRWFRKKNKHKFHSGLSQFQTRRRLRLTTRLFSVRCFSALWSGNGNRFMIKQQ